MPPLFADLPTAFADSFDTSAPWSLLGVPLDRVLERLPERDVRIDVPPGVHLEGDRIVIGEGTTIGAGTVIRGPAWIGEGVEIRPGVFIRSGAWIGDGAVVGASTEVKHSILFAGAHAPHLNYVGDSILGARVNLGAGTILSNFRHDGGQIMVQGPDGPIDSGRRKLGAVLGDDAATGCNSVLHPGVVVGRGTQIYPGVQLRSGIYPADSLVKLRQEIEIVERR